MKNSKVILLSLKFKGIYLCLLFTISSCTIQPLAWEPEDKPPFQGQIALNENLKRVSKISLEGWYGPEDITVDNFGNIYSGVHKGKEDFSDGKILKINPDGEVEVFYDANSWVAGLEFDKEGNLIALSHKEGLISISPDKEVKVLAKEDENGKPFLIPNGLDIANDGTIYFSNTSWESAYNLKYGRRLILEMKPNGGLYKYHPETKKITTLIDGTWFGNGVVLSKNEDFVLLVETSKYRVLRYWLKGDKKGQTETFIKNLPGFPNGISIREDGSFWLGFTTLRNDALDKIHPNSFMKKIVYYLPPFLQPKQQDFGMILNISEEGEIIRSYFDTTGSILPEAGTVKEFKGSLYIGGDLLPFIGKYDLED